MDDSGSFWAKATRSLAGAVSEFANGRYENCANRCYYACFQAAISSLIAAGIHARGDHWSHEFVQAELARQLIRQRKILPSSIRSTLLQIHALRLTADYTVDLVSETQASRAISRAEEFLDAIAASRR